MGLLYRLVTSYAFQRTGLARGLTTFVGWLADRRLPKWILLPVIRKYIRVNGIDMSQYQGDPESFSTFNRFFTRALKPGCRIQGNGVTSPADGVVTAAGTFTESMLFHVKGNSYPLTELLRSAWPDTGSFVTVYLSPADYHRVHTPFNCTVTSIRHLHGEVRTVDPAYVLKHPGLYCTNERVVVEGTSPYGKFCLVLVGALVVGRITLSIVDKINKGGTMENLNIELEKGAELGMFEMGSTVVLVMESDALKNTGRLTGEHVLLGTTIS